MAEFERAIPAKDRPEIHALDHAVKGVMSNVYRKY